jgi:hypothetical protein
MDQNILAQSQMDMDQPIWPAILHTEDASVAIAKELTAIQVNDYHSWKGCH